MKPSVDVEATRDVTIIRIRYKLGDEFEEENLVSRSKYAALIKRMHHKLLHGNQL